MLVALYRGTSWMSTLIKWQTRGDYSHVSIILNDGNIIEAWQLGKGVRLIRDLGEKHSKNTPVDIFEVEVSPAQYAVMKAFLLAQLGKKYDWRAIFRFLTKSHGDNKDKWICSELVFAAFKKAGIDLLSRTEAYQVSPSLLSRSPLLRFVESVETK